MEMPVIAYYKIRPLRESKGLKQADIANELGVSRPTYTLMERGEREPTMTQLFTLARLLGVSTGELCSVVASYQPIKADYPKFKELVAACLGFGADQGLITKTKLGKLAYLADLAWYYDHKQPMTGVTYRATLKGPQADDYLRAVDELYDQEAISIESRGAALIIRLLEQQPAALLTEQELDLIHTICIKWKYETTEAINSFTRAQAPWELAKLDEPVAYEAILNMNKELLY
ncbi:MAG TPA: helix-turn-helix transcriptional regulator [Candidatus Pristimantibacillus sp.]|nr:helix-turn-helix transcriptional regulator [Candidatus Pristimantibacillus sp.]